MDEGVAPPWPVPPAALALAEDEVHVWRASLELPVAHVQWLRRTLSADELARAKRFHFQRDRRRYIIAHGILRVILGRYTGVGPSQLRFEYNPHGKPELAPSLDLKPLSFNLSHSQEVVLYAFTRGRQIGIDLEQIRTDFPCEEIAEQFFSPQENAALQALPHNKRHEAFFRCWTRKEAYLKARGEGLSLPLHDFSVSLVPGEPASLLGIRGDPEAAAGWALRGLLPTPGYVGTLAVEGHNWQMSCWEWSEELAHTARSGQ